MELFSDFTMTIDGKAVDSNNPLPVINPADEAVFAQAPDCSQAQLDDAVTAAKEAFPGWSQTPIEERRACLNNFAQAVEDNSDALAKLLSTEQGKSLDGAKLEFTLAINMLRKATTLEIPTTLAEDTEEYIVETHHVPIGVAGAIVPWNYPVLLMMFKLPYAVLAGNTIIIKPSPHTPLTTLKLGEIGRNFFPPGVFNVISGGDDIGPWMTSHPGIDKISFTGSTQTGKRVMQSASSTLKRITLELGGNDAAIILPDVDIKAMIEGIFWQAFDNSGQVCIASKRMYIHEDIYDDVANALVEYAKLIKVGNAAEADSVLGPVNNKAQYERVLDLIADSKANGYTFLAGEEPMQGPGYFIPITLIDNPPKDSRIIQEEQFGPVLPLIKFKDIDQVIEQVNDCDYGLAGTIWTQDDNKAVDIAKRLQTGTVFINKLMYVCPFASFSGHKQSGLGTECGVEGLLEYTNSQTFVRAKLTN